MKIILFDIDKTLIKNYKRTGNIWADLFREVYGCKSNFGTEKVVAHGKTMKQIVFEALINEGFKKEEIESKWSLFKKVLIKKYVPLLESVESFEALMIH